MKRPPVFLFAFANQQDAYLEALKGEERGIRECLSGLHDQQYVEFLSLGNTSLDDIYRNFNRFHNRIAVFHYGGHSGSEGLQLEDSHTRAANLATLMGMQGQLQLVVLNGCSNRAQAVLLLEVGVKVVVGTSCDIDDDKAGIFARQFYDALAKGKNIRQAFDGAISYLSDKKGMDTSRVSRGPVQRAGAELPWGLYYREEEALLWTAPENPAESRTADEKAYLEDISLPHRKVNESLILQAARGLGRYQPEVEARLQQYRQAPHPELFHELKDQVLKHFPSIVSSRIGALFSPSAQPFSRQRLAELNLTYLALCRFLAGIALSNLWDACLDSDYQPKVDFTIQPAYRQDLLDYLALNEKKAGAYDYLWLLATIHGILKENGAEFFLSELGELNGQLAEDKSFYDAYRFLEQELRQPLLAGKVHKDDIANLCLQAEVQLGRLLEACAFLSTYDMATIRDIRVTKSRREAGASFWHDNALMRGSQNNIPVFSVSREHFTENQAVVLAKSILTDEKVLNLTPFIIDLNAYATKKGGPPDIQFLYGTGDNGMLCYQRAREMKDLYYVEKEAEDPFMSYANINLDFDGMGIFYSLLEEFKADLKLK